MKATVIRLGESEGQASPAEGKWTVAELLEHLVMTYEMALEELAGRKSATPRVGTLKATALRLILLPHIIFHKSIPVRAKAPREIRPTGARSDCSELLELLSTLAEEVVLEARKAHEQRGRKVNHPYFGPIRPLQLIGFLTAHLHHHHRQLQSLSGSRAHR